MGDFIVIAIVVAVVGFAIYKGVTRKKLPLSGPPYPVEEDEPVKPYRRDRR